MTAPRTVLLAAPRSFCAGVERAIEIVELALAQRGAPVYVRKQIVHNTHVVAELEARGAIFVSELDAVPDGSCVVFAAHGVSPTVRRDASARGLDVIDATCPLVAKVHHEARRYAARGDTVILIGHSGHEEVHGTMGEAPESIVLVESEADVATVEVVDPQRVSYLTQTTLSVTETDRIIAALRQRFPRLRGPASEDICYATSNRQSALADIAGRSQLVLVLGSQNSSNSRRLAELAADAGAVSHLIEDVDQIDPRWLDGVTVVGLTAGASAPPRLVSEVVEYLRTLGPVVVEENPVVVEDISFSLPLSVREPGVTRLHIDKLLLDKSWQVVNRCGHEHRDPCRAGRRPARPAAHAPAGLPRHPAGRPVDGAVAGATTTRHRRRGLVRATARRRPADRYRDGGPAGRRAVSRGRSLRSATPLVVHPAGAGHCAPSRAPGRRDGVAGGRGGHVGHQSAGRRRSHRPRQIGPAPRRRRPLRLDSGPADTSE